jgi:DNA-binding MarR family transcriptional regulator
MRVDAGGTKRLKLLVLIAAYADAGEPSPAAGTLAARMQLPVPAVDQLLAALERQGLVEVVRGDVTKHERNTYRLRLTGDAA